MKSNATTYKVEGELRDWLRDYAKERNLTQTHLVNKILEAEMKRVAANKEAK